MAIDIVDAMEIYRTELNLWQVVPIHASGVNKNGRWVVERSWVIRDCQTPMFPDSVEAHAAMQMRIEMSSEFAQVYPTMRALEAVLHWAGLETE